VEALLALLLAAQAPQAPPADTAAVTLAKSIEARERGLQDLEADFEQHYRSSAIGREIVEKGRVSLKPPGRMLFEYATPEKKTFVSDGQTSYFYVPKDRQVVVQRLKGDKGLLAALLTGRENLLDRFTASLVPREGKGQSLRLEPRQKDPEVEEVLMDVDESLLIERLEIRDVQGNRTEFRFQRMRPNTGLSDRLFHFEIPHGVEVVEG
jgi:outer membrane lipoprotein carrier protein